MNTKRQRLLVVHFEGVGDNVLSIPFLSLVRKVFTSHDLYLLVGQGRRALFIGLDGYEIIETPESTDVRRVLSLDYEIVFDLGTGPWHITRRIKGAELRYRTYIGFAKPASIPREVVVHRSSTIPMWRQFVSLLSALGVSVQCKPERPFAISDFSKQYAEMLLDLKPDLPLICIAPGAASDSRKRWSPENFASVTRKLHTLRPCRFVLLGAQYEMSIGEAIVSYLDFEIDNLMGLTTLGCVAYILQRCDLLVTNDNGLLHLGGLLDIPTIGLFGPTSSLKWHPLGDRSRVLTSTSNDVNDIEPASVTEVCAHLMGWDSC